MRQRLKQNERAFIIVWFFFMMSALLAMAALAIDLGNWYAHVQRAQRAADAAALAGDPYLPNDPAMADQVARQTLRDNGVAESFVTTAVVNPVAGNPTALYVAVQTSAKNTFLKIVGGSTANTFTRKAIAVYTPGLQMGNGSNLLGGHEPLDGGSPWGLPTTWDGDYWIGIEGTGAPKVDGDRYMAGVCNDDALYGVGYAPNGVDNCAANVNLEQDNRGYAFHIHTRPWPSGGVRNLIIESFDAGYADAGGLTCSGPEGVGVYMPDPGHCAPDADGHYATLPSGNQDTYYDLYASVSSVTPIASCQMYPGTQNASVSVVSDPFAASWIHHWSQVCNSIPVDLSKANDYVLRIRSQGGAGVNNFMLRAGLSTTTDRSGVDIPMSRWDVTLTADENIAVYNQYNGGAGTTRFPIGQVDTSFAGQTIEIEFYDIGDARDSSFNYVTPTIALVQSDTGAIVPGNCLYTPPPANGYVAIPGCVATASPNGDQQGQILKFAWQVPSNYVCTPVGILRNDGCWISVRMGFPPGSDVHDFTTWSLRKPPSPLHISK